MICALTGKRMSRSQLIPLDLVSRQSPIGSAPITPSLAPTSS